jgi:predicted amidohydrolase
MALKGAEIIVIISNVVAMANFRMMSYAIPIARAIENQVHVIFCNGCANLVAGKKEVKLLGESRIINSLGEVVSEAHEEEGVIRGAVSEEELKKGASFLSIFRDRQVGAYKPLLEQLKGTG